MQYTGNHHKPSREPLQGGAPSHKRVDSPMNTLDRITMGPEHIALW